MTVLVPANKQRGGGHLVMSLTKYGYGHTWSMTLSKTLYLFIEISQCNLILLYLPKLLVLTSGELRTSAFFSQRTVSRLQAALWYEQGT